MGKIIKEFNDGSYLEYNRGRFDDWCVYLTKTDATRKPPRDTDYFQQLKELSNTYGSDRVYGDYVKVYELTGKSVEDNVLNQISEIANNYGADSLEVDIMFSILYMAMISKENRISTKLGKRIKRLGIHELLIGNKSVQYSANFMRDMGWREISDLCNERVF